MYITDLFHPLVQAAHDRRCRELGLQAYQSLPPMERVRLDLELLDRFNDSRVPAEVRQRVREWLYADVAAGKQK